MLLFLPRLSPTPWIAIEGGWHDTWPHCVPLCVKISTFNPISLMFWQSYVNQCGMPALVDVITPAVITNSWKTTALGCKGYEPFITPECRQSWSYINMTMSLNHLCTEHESMLQTHIIHCRRPRSAALLLHDTRYVRKMFNFMYLARHGSHEHFEKGKMVCPKSSSECHLHQISNCHFSKSSTLLETKLWRPKVVQLSQNLAVL